jgi:hypothetical protein
LDSDLLALQDGDKDLDSEWLPDGDGETETEGDPDLLPDLEPDCDGLSEPDGLAEADPEVISASIGLVHIA